MSPIVAVNCDRLERENIMTRQEFDKLSEDERECLEWAIGDFWSDHNFRERIKALLHDIEYNLHSGSPRHIDNLSDYAEELQGVCSDAQRFWKRYAENALKEFREYEEA